MAKITVEQFTDLVERSKLVDAGQLSRALADIRSRGTPEQLQDADFFVAELIAADLLTRWQSENLLKGGTRASSSASTSCWAIWAPAA